MTLFSNLQKVSELIIMRSFLTVFFLLHYLNVDKIIKMQ